MPATSKFLGKVFLVGTASVPQRHNERGPDGMQIEHTEPEGKSFIALLTFGDSGCAGESLL